VKVIAIDFDGVLSIDDKPIVENVQKVNELFENRNNFIVIYTARSKNIRKETEDLLSNYKVKYHALVMEKIRADYYVDDRNSDLDSIF
jgi:ribonucleotide monophosphatase NagD (HAD superfamily)